MLEARPLDRLRKIQRYFSIGPDDGMERGFAWINYGNKPTGIPYRTLSICFPIRLQRIGSSLCAYNYAASYLTSPIMNAT